MERDNRTHRLLGELIRRMEKNQYSMEYTDLSPYIHPWYKRIFPKFFPHSIYTVRGLFERLSADKIYLGTVGEFNIDLDSDDLYLFRNIYELGEYKEPRRWWLTSLEIILAGGAIATIIGVFDNRQVPVLRDKIIQKEERIKSITTQAAKDSITIASIRDSIKILKDKILYLPKHLPKPDK